MPPDFMIFQQYFIIYSLAKSRKSDGKVKSSLCKARES